MSTNIRIHVHLKDQTFLIPCGEGNQKIRWLGDVAILRYEHFHEAINGILINIISRNICLGTPKGMRFEDGSFLDMNMRINEYLKIDMHVWFILKGIFNFSIKEDLDALIESEEKDRIPEDLRSDDFTNFDGESESRSRKIKIRK